MALALGALVPMLVFAALVAVELGFEVRSQTERRLVNAAEATISAFEKEIEGTLRSLQILATSEHLRKGELEGFQQEAIRARDNQPSWLNVVLLDPVGNILIWPGAKSGTPFGVANDLASALECVREKHPILGNLTKGRGGHWAFPVRVPVFIKGQVAYVLTAVISPEGLAKATVPSELLMPEYTRVIVDANQTVAMRTRDSHRFVGQRARTSFVQKTQSDRGIFRDTTLDGLASYVGFSRSSRWGWVAAVADTAEAVQAPLRRYVLISTASGTIALVLGLWLAVLLANRIRKGIGSAEAAASSLVNGERCNPTIVQIEEIDRLNVLLQKSFELLTDRERERDAHRSGLERAVQARDEFLSLASHELKTPLTALSLGTHRLALRLSKSPGEAELALEQFRGQVRRLNRLIDDMLDISRIQSGKLALRTRPMDLAEMATEVVEHLWAHLSPNSPPVQIRATAPVVGEWDRDRLEQVLTNLLTNAAKYAPGTAVTVSVFKNESSAILEVSDAGPGMDEKTKGRIFGKFERGVDRNEVTGLGLGLFIAQNIVSLHGGTISVESEQGNGSVFTIHLPGAVVTDVQQTG